MNSQIDFPTIRAILKKAFEKLKTAQIDFANDRFDDSVSRAYYAAFHAVSAVLLSKGLHYSSHSQVLGNFNKEFVKTGTFPSNVTKIIQQLFEERQTGDYDFDVYITKEEAGENLKNAESILTGCREYLVKLGMPDL